MNEAKLMMIEILKKLDANNEQIKRMLNEYEVRVNLKKVKRRKKWQTK